MVVAGKECTKYTAAIFLMGQVVKQTAWIYKGVKHVHNTGRRHRPGDGQEQNAAIP